MQERGRKRGKRRNQKKEEGMREKFIGEDF